MSMRTMAFSSSNRNSASARAVSVLPTPVGPRKRKEPTAAPRELKGKDARAVEVAIVLAPKGKHRLTVQEPTLKVGGSVELDVKREIWVVMEMRQGDPKGRFRVYEYPDDVGRFVPLVPVPD